jgi:Flp pilus assembly protein TadG
MRIFGWQMIGANSRFTALTRDDRGNVLPLAAIGMLLSAALVGGGIDMSRAYRVQNRLQAACDSGVLAGRRAVGSDGFNEAAEVQARSYFGTNFNDASQETTNTTFVPMTEDEGQTIEGRASTRLNLAVMKIFGFQPFELSVSCQASMGVGNSDVIMVLDTTGSMGTSMGGGTTRMTALRAAMKNFYTTVKNATANSNARIRYGFVPYSSSVNVGHLLMNLNPSYLVDTYRIQSREQVQKWSTTSSNTTQEFRNESYTSPTQYSPTDYRNQNSCNNNLNNNTPWQNNGSAPPIPPNTIMTSDGKQVTTTTTVQPQSRTLYVCVKNDNDNRWYRNSYTGTRDRYTYTVEVSELVFDYWNYRQIEYDVSAYKTFASVSTNTGNDGASVSSTWAGCIEERGTDSASAFSYSSVTGISPSTALDLDIDLAPTGDNATKWAPLWPQVSFYRRTSSGSLTNNATSRWGQSASAACPSRAQLLTEMSQSAFNSYADALVATGNTYLDIGMIWGGRLLSPTGIFSENVKVDPANGGEVSRHLIFMTDGIMEPNNLVHSAYGIEYHDRRVTSNGSSNHASRHTSRFRTVCEAIKAKGIRIWTISFTSGVSTDLRNCASPDSAFNANDSAELDAAFQEIAKQVGELRLTQ